jgi:hypothetical protein
MGLIGYWKVLNLHSDRSFHSDGRGRAPNGSAPFLRNPILHTVKDSYSRCLKDSRLPLNDEDGLSWFVVPHGHGGRRE